MLLRRTSWEGVAGAALSVAQLRDGRLAGTMAGKEGEPDRIKDWRLLAVTDTALLPRGTTDSELREGERVNDLRPGRGRVLGVDAGEGVSLVVTGIKFEVSDSGRRFNVAGLWRTSAGEGTATVTSTGETTVAEAGEETTVVSSMALSKGSSSSSSSTSVPNCSFEPAVGMNLPNESRLFEARELRPLPYPAPMPGGYDGFVAESNKGRMSVKHSADSVGRTERTKIKPLFNIWCVQLGDLHFREAANISLAFQRQEGSASY